MGVRIDLEKRARRHHVRGDSTRLHQVFWNLLSNAIRHSGAGGRIAEQLLRAITRVTSTARSA